LTELRKEKAKSDMALAKKNKNRAPRRRDRVCDKLKAWEKAALKPKPVTRCERTCENAWKK